MSWKLFSQIALAIMFVTAGAPAFAQLDAQFVVSIVENNGSVQLHRGGQPYTIKGAGGEGSVELLAACGGNSTRHWGVDDNTQARLDAAHAQGLTVALGIWLEHESDWFNYNNADVVNRQVELVMAAVRRYKDHPAVLVWGIGNEMENINSGGADNPAIWNHVEKLAGMIKEEDPNHPVMTVVAEVGANKIRAIHSMCPSIDIVGINSYGGAASLPGRYRQEGGTKPYIVTEFGPVGTWEVPKNNIDAIIEPTSTAKTQFYRDALAAFDEDTELCLGSYAFLWGDKQEATATWFGLLSPRDGRKTAPVDHLIERWTGKASDDLCPVIHSFTVNGPNSVEAGSTVETLLSASDPEGRPLSVRWELMREASEYVTGGFKQDRPPTFPDAFIEGNINGAKFIVPEEAGLYRVYAYVTDGNGAAIANYPLRVESRVVASSSAVPLPYSLYSEASGEMAYYPSGFMGSTDSIEVTLDCTEEPAAGQTCVKCVYDRTDDWGGVVWQNPENDWGDVDGGLNLTGANKLTFRARGSSGGEEIAFGVGLIGRDKPYFDTTRKEIKLTLTSQWQQYEIDLSSADMTRIKSGFYWSLAGQGRPLTFYLDDITFEGTSQPGATMPSGNAQSSAGGQGAASNLPYILFDEPGGNFDYSPSGFMGSTDAITVDLEHTGNPAVGTTCIRCEYDKTDEWGGVVWQSPENDWGDLPGGLNLTGASTLKFRARGNAGGEKITFGVGVIGSDKPHFDTVRKDIEITLTNEWQQFEIDLSGCDLTRVKSGFFWSLAGQGSGLTFYLDDIRFE
ncbi:MAG: glycoside hydrolase family 2 TIM barrel-domain containing protein [Planctomycetota bacterium]